MKKIILLVAITLLTVFAVVAVAEDKDSKAVKNWSDQAEVTAVDISGNTRAPTISVKNELKCIEG